MVGRALALVVLGCACQRGASERADAPSASDAGVDAPRATFQPYWTSGTRFRARLWKPADDSDPIFAGWRDTLLDTDCELAKTTDGVERCLPITLRSYDAYADPQATQRVTSALGSVCGRNKYAHQYYLSLGSRRYRLFPLTATYVGPVYSASGQFLGNTSDFPNEFFRVGAEEPPESFAMAQYAQVQVGAHIHEQYGFGDGSSIDTGVLVLPAGRCRPVGGIRPGSSACRPIDAGDMPWVFRDAACTQPALLYEMAPPESPYRPRPDRVVLDDPSGCGSSLVVYDVGNIVSSGVYYENTNGTCTEHRSIVYSLFEGTVNSTYPMGMVAPSVRTGRLGHVMWTGPDGVAIPMRSFDQDLGVSCIASGAEDGVLRCLPYLSGPDVAGHLSPACDDEQQTRVATCELGPPFSYAAVPTQSCGNRVAVHAFESPSTLYQASGMTCAPYPVQTYARSGVIADPAMFPALQEIIE